MAQLHHEPDERGVERAVADVAHEHGEARHVAQRVADALRHGLEVLEALGGLLQGAAFDQLAGLRVEGQLGRQVVVMGECRGLRVQGAYGRALHVPCQDYVVTAHWGTCFLECSLDDCVRSARAAPRFPWGCGPARPPALREGCIISFCASAQNTFQAIY